MALFKVWAAPLVMEQQQAYREGCKARGVPAVLAETQYMLTAQQLSQTTVQLLLVGEAAVVAVALFLVLPQKIIQLAVGVEVEAAPVLTAEL
jgi:hypothetical protein